MRFLLEADMSGKSMKDFAELNNKTPYEKLSSAGRSDFILSWLKKRPNYKTLKPAQASIVSAIKDNSEFNKVSPFMAYIDKIDNVKLNDSIVDVVAQILQNNKVDFSQAEKWLINNPSLYNRPTDEVIYALKALTLLSNDELKNNYFDEGTIDIKDLFDGNELKNSAEIKDILNSKQSKNFIISKSDKMNKLDDRSKDAAAKVSRVVNYTTKEAIKKELSKDEYKVLIGALQGKLDDILNKTYDADQSIDDNIASLIDEMNRQRDEQEAQNK